MGSGWRARLGLRNASAGGTRNRLGLGRIGNDGVALDILGSFGLVAVRLGSAVGLGGDWDRNDGREIAVAAGKRLIQFLLILDHLVESWTLGLGLVGDRRRGRLLERPLGGEGRLG